MQHEFFIAGVQFRPKTEISKAISVLEIGNNLNLTPEPLNKFDSNAIKIELEKSDGVIFLGYVPAKISSSVLAMIEIHNKVTCTLTEFNPKSDPWEMFKVTIKPEEE